VRTFPKVTRINYGSPAEAIRALHDLYGSDDALVNVINGRYGTRLTRQTLIRWRKDKGGISQAWAETLANFTGWPVETFRESVAAQRHARRHLEERVAELERWCEEIDRRLTSHLSAA
jgi:hypothetical protein